MWLALLLVLLIRIEAGADGGLANTYARQIAVVTGGNRGIGYEVVRQLCLAGYSGRILLTARSTDRGMRALRQLARYRCHPVFYRLDVSSRDSCNAFAAYVRATYGRLDVLVNNAGVRYRPANHSVQPTAFSPAIKSNMHVNFYSTAYLLDRLRLLLHRHARVVNLSSPCGRVAVLPSVHLRSEFTRPYLTAAKLHDLLDRYRYNVESGNYIAQGWGDDPYCLSKLAVTAMTGVIQRQINVTRPNDDIVINSYSPANVSLDVLRYDGPVAVQLAAKNIVKLATLPVDVQEPVGKYVWYDMTVVDWTQVNTSLT